MRILIISDVSEIEETVASLAQPYSDQDELKKLWQQPMRLFRLSNALRKKSCKDVVSFVINRNINFTNECTGTCQVLLFQAQ